MASEHDSLEPVSQLFIHDDSSAESMNTPFIEDLDNLFGPMYEEYFEKRSSEVSIDMYGYCKNHKKVVKTRQTRTRERIECTRAGSLIAKRLNGQPWSTQSQPMVNNGQPTKDKNP
ncbi:hypothetical protein Tco_0827857 [Tanacetum coccineum]